MKPVELYRFTQGADVYTYTSADHDIVYSAETYVSTAIGRTGIELKQAISRANIDVTMSLSHSQAAAWLTGARDERIGLTLFTQDALGTDVFWKGRMVGMKPRKADIVFNFESIFTTLRRAGLRPRFQVACRHALYRGKCRLDKEDFAETMSATVVSADGLTITVPDAAGAPAGDFFTGMLQYSGVYRMITSHSGATIVLARPLPSLSAASLPVDVILYPGCDRSSARCHDRFNNRLNHGGFRWIPIRNPFDGSVV